MNIKTQETNATYANTDCINEEAHGNQTGTKQTKQHKHTTNKNTTTQINKQTNKQQTTKHRKLNNQTHERIAARY